MPKGTATFPPLGHQTSASPTRGPGFGRWACFDAGPRWRHRPGGQQQRRGTISSTTATKLDAAEDNHHLAVKLAGSGGNRHGIGAKVTVTTKQRQPRSASCAAATNYASHNPFEVHFRPSRTRTVADVVVRWPNGCRDIPARRDRRSTADHRAGLDATRNPRRRGAASVPATPTTAASRRAENAHRPHPRDVEARQAVAARPSDATSPYIKGLAKEMGGAERIARQHRGGPLHHPASASTRWWMAGSFLEAGPLVGATEYDDNGNLTEFTPGAYVMGALPSSTAAPGGPSAATTSPSPAAVRTTSTNTSGQFHPAVGDSIRHPPTLQLVEGVGPQLQVRRGRRPHGPAQRRPVVAGASSC